MNKHLNPIFYEAGGVKRKEDHELVLDASERNENVDARNGPDVVNNIVDKVNLELNDDQMFIENVSEKALDSRNDESVRCTESSSVHMGSGDCLIDESVPLKWKSMENEVTTERRKSAEIENCVSLECKSTETGNCVLADNKSTESRLHSERNPTEIGHCVPVEQKSIETGNCVLADNKSTESRVHSERKSTEIGHYLSSECKSIESRIHSERKSIEIGNCVPSEQKSIENEHWMLADNKHAENEVNSERKSTETGNCVASTQNSTENGVTLDRKSTEIRNRVSSECNFTEIGNCILADRKSTENGVTSERKSTETENCVPSEQKSTEIRSCLSPKRKSTENFATSSLVENVLSTSWSANVDQNGLEFDVEDESMNLVEIMHNKERKCLSDGVDLVEIVTGPAKVRSYKVKLPGKGERFWVKFVDNVHLPFKLHMKCADRVTKSILKSLLRSKMDGKTLVRMPFERLKVNGYVLVLCDKHKLRRAQVKRIRSRDCIELLDIDKDVVYFAHLKRVFVLDDENLAQIYPRTFVCNLTEFDGKDIFWNETVKALYRSLICTSRRVYMEIRCVHTQHAHTQHTQLYDVNMKLYFGVKKFVNFNDWLGNSLIPYLVYVKKTRAEYSSRELTKVSTYPAHVFFPYVKLLSV